MLATIGNSWDFSIPVPPSPLEVIQWYADGNSGPCPSSLITLYNTTKQGINFQGNFTGGQASCLNAWEDNNYGWDLFYGSINRLLYDEPSNDIDKCRMAAILSDAPDYPGGPFYRSFGSGDHGVSGWRSSRRFFDGYPTQRDGDDDFMGNFNGLDYMLFHNLYYLENDPQQSHISLIMSSLFYQFNGWTYTIGPPFINLNQFQNILVDNTAIAHYQSIYGSAIIVGGSQGVTIGDNVIVEEGASLDVHNDIGCSVSQDSYVFNSSAYRSMITNSSQDSTSNTLIVSHSNNNVDHSLAPYMMSNEFKTDFKGEYNLSNYPNPFNDNTTIAFSIKEKANVNITVTDIYGKELEELVNNASYEKGNYTVNLNSAKFAAGIYYCQMKANEFSKTIKLIIAK